MAGALQRLDPGGSVQDLRSRVQVKSITSNVFSISVQGATPAQAVLTANAVTDSYLSYVRSITPPGPGPVRVINLSSSSVEQPRTTRLLVSAGLGVLLGALVSAIGAAFRRGRRFGIR
jgi:capsular polysaccharide biosynthesis protein